MKIKLSLFFCIVTTFIFIGCNYVSDGSPEGPVPEPDPDPSIEYTISYLPDSDITIDVADNNNGTYTFKAPDGYDKYEWRIDDDSGKAACESKDYLYTPDGTAQVSVLLIAVKNNIFSSSHIYFKKFASKK